VRTWMDVYRQRERWERQVRFLEQVRLNRAAWSRAPPIVDLADPHGKRFLFQGPSRWAHGSTDDPQAL
jgi:hypothetical protein